MSRSAVPSGVRRSWGHDDDGCSILHVDMDAFFASVEIARRPHLAGLPVIVGGSDRSVVLAATYEARAFGVHAAMPMSQARRRCPQAVVVPPDHSAYRAASGQAMGVMRDMTAVMEQVSIDEAFLDVSGARRRVGGPLVIAEQIRERVRREVGVTCSVGIAATKSMAKLASGMAKPDGVVLVPRAATVELLRSLPVAALWGVGDRTRELLERWGIETVAQLADADPLVLQRAVGAATGRHLHDLAWGRDPRPVVPGHVEKSIGAETTFESDLRDATRIEAHLLALADRCARQLREKERCARTVTLKVRTTDWRTVTRSRTLVAPTDVAREVYLIARELFAGLDLRGQAVRLVGVRLEGLVDDAERQPTLEEAVIGAPAQRRAEQAVDEVRSRFGLASVRPATSLRSSSRRSTTAHPRGELS
ncbi:DNA polymerase IV [Actinotalea sp.]|uniref:DNA polymerase IV n=1 Tax=Actinotalea sp. TaxID=1872145 RepID=UPI003561E89E